MSRVLLVVLCLWAFGLRDRVIADAIDDYISREMVRREVPGLALALIEGTNVVKLKGYGIADRESGTPATAETRFEIGSITKQFTATLILMLREEGKIHLEDRLARFVAGSPDDWSAITIRHL